MVKLAVLRQKPNWPDSFYFPDLAKRGREKKKPANTPAYISAKTRLVSMYKEWIFQLWTQVSKTWFEKKVKKKVYSW